MRHVWRDAEYLAGTHHDLASSYGEFQSPFEDVRELLIDMAMHWDNASLFEQHSRQHNVVSNYELAIKQRVQLLKFNVIPTVVTGLYGDAFRSFAHAHFLLDSLSDVGELESRNPMY
jgi:hypothetical protein